MWAQLLTQVLRTCSRGHCGTVARKKFGLVGQSPERLVPSCLPEGGSESLFPGQKHCRLPEVRSAVRLALTPVMWAWVKRNHHPETAGFSLCFHLPRFHFGYLSLTHNPLALAEVEDSSHREAMRPIWRPTSRRSDLVFWASQNRIRTPLKFLKLGGFLLVSFKRNPSKRCSIFLGMLGRVIWLKRTLGMSPRFKVKPSRCWHAHPPCHNIQRSSANVTP